MKELFDLQLFAEDADIGTESTKTTKNTQTTDSNPQEQPEEVHTDTKDAPKEHKEEIPPELAGVSEDVARQILDESKPKEEESSLAEADSENKQVEDEPLEQPHNPIPYARFKEVNDQVKSLKDELAKLKGNGSSPAEKSEAPQPVMTASKPLTQPALPQPQMKLTPEIIGKIDEVARAEAMSMTGLSKEDIAAFEYADDDDPKKKLWQSALPIAKNKTITAVMQAANKQRASQAQFMVRHAKSVEDFNNFYRAQAAENDFNSIKEYAANDYFSKLSDADKPIISEAYARIERNVASPQDIFCIKNYFTEAKNAYRSKHPVEKKPENTIDKTKEKLKEMEKHPKSEQIKGTTTTQGGAITTAKLEKMLQTMPWEQIPDEYKKMLLKG